MENPKRTILAIAEVRLIDGMGAIDHEAQTNYQKETHHKLRPALAGSRTR